jgi:hypothetical protein
MNSRQKGARGEREFRDVLSTGARCVKSAIAILLLSPLVIAAQGPRYGAITNFASGSNYIRFRLITNWPAVRIMLSNGSPAYVESAPNWAGKIIIGTNAFQVKHTTNDRAMPPEDRRQ